MNNKGVRSGESCVVGSPRLAPGVRPAAGWIGIGEPHLTPSGSLGVHGKQFLFVAAVAGFLGTACTGAGEDRVLAIQTSGVLTGLVYFDANANREPDVNDTPLAQVRVALLAAGTSDTVVIATSDDQGVLDLSSVPVGDYRVVVDTTTIGDTTIVARIDTADIRVTPDDSVDIAVAISFPLLLAAEARALPVGSKVFVDGIALNTAGTFGDSTMHVADTSGTIRAIKTGLGVAFPGDSVRLRGTMATRDGQPVLNLDRRAPLVLAIAELPVPDTLTTVTAAAANGSVLDAAFVVIDSARITDTATVTNDLVVTVDDGSGALDVALDGDITFNLGPFLIPGADLTTLKGVLVSDGAGSWRLKPRSAADVTLDVPVLSIGRVRGMAAGARVFIDGVALNSWTAFGDSTISVSDSSGTIMATRVAQITSFAGDSVRLVGTTAMRDGQPIMDNVTAFVLSFGNTPPPEQVTTGIAATADGGRLDAAFAQVLTAPITDTATVDTNFVVTVDDGSGPLKIVLVGGAAAPPRFNVTGMIPGASITARGILVPDGFGGWVLKPRQISDVN